MGLRDKMTGPSKEQIFEEFKKNGMSDDLMNVLSSNEEAYWAIVNLLAENQSDSKTRIRWFNAFFDQLKNEKFLKINPDKL